MGYRSSAAEEPDLLRNQVRSLADRCGDFNGAGPAHVFPVVLVLGATPNADLVSASVSRLPWPQKLVGTAMQ